MESIAWMEGSRPYWMIHTPSSMGKEHRTVAKHLSEFTEWLTSVNPSNINIAYSKQGDSNCVLEVPTEIDDINKKVHCSFKFIYLRYYHYLRFKGYA